MLQYCEQLEETLREINYDEKRFLESHTYQNAAAERMGCEGRGEGVSAQAVALVFQEM